MRKLHTHTCARTGVPNNRLCVELSFCTPLKAVRTVEICCPSTRPPALRSMFPRALKGDDRLLHAALCGELGLEGKVRPLHFAKWVLHALSAVMCARLRFATCY